jgi:hypothetical protein
MKTPAPADNIYEVLSPVWWVMDGKPISSYPLSTFWPQLANYARNNGRVPAASIGALSALVLLSLVFFLLWCVFSTLVWLKQHQQHSAACPASKQ